VRLIVGAGELKERHELAGASAKWWLDVFAYGHFQRSWNIYMTHIDIWLY